MSKKYGFENYNQHTWSRRDWHRFAILTSEQRSELDDLHDDLMIEEINHLYDNKTVHTAVITTPKHTRIYRYVPRHARITDPGTSQTAAPSESRCERLYDIICDLLSDGTPRSILQCAQESGIAIQTISPRFAELVDMKVLEVVGQTKNSTGKTARTYKIKE